LYIIITASPNKDGLTAACGEAALKGIKATGGEAELIDISAGKLEPCRICGNGWGQCRSASKCVIDDMLPVLQEKIRDTEGVMLITPVYFCQPSERMRYFLDRFRRCEAFSQNGSVAQGKPFGLVAAAGGSGNGTATCLAEMEQWCRYVRAVPQARIGITRFNRELMLQAISDAAGRLGSGEYVMRF